MAKPVLRAEYIMAEELALLYYFPNHSIRAAHQRQSVVNPEVIRLGLLLNLPQGSPSAAFGQASWGYGGSQLGGMTCLGRSLGRLCRLVRSITGSSTSRNCCTPLASPL